jgi:hypothetical protein
MKLGGCWKQLFLTVFCLSLTFGCGGGGGSQVNSGNPVPALTGVSPNTAIAGAAALPVTVSGNGFINASVIEWNGTALATSYVSSTSLTATIPSSDLTSAGTARVTVQNPAPDGGISGSVSFTINAAAAYLNVLDVGGVDLAWNPSQQKLYVAVPSTANVDASTITMVDPIAGSVGDSQQLVSGPYGLAISDDSQYLYAVISGGTTIQRLALPALTPDFLWSLGTDPTSGNPNLAGDIEVQPGAAHTLAVSLGEYGSGSVAVFDDGVERSSVASVGYPLGNSVQWSTDGSELYAANTVFLANPYSGGSGSDNALCTMPVTTNGVGSVTTYNATFRGGGVRLHSDPTTGYIYGDWGEVVNGATGIPVGNYAWDRPTGTYFPGPLSIVDPTIHLFYTLLEVSEPDGMLAFQIQEFDQTQFQLKRTIVIPNASGQAANFIRWGNAGLAFVTNAGNGANGKLYILDGSFVNPSGTQDTSAGTPVNPVPILTAISPITATVGSTAISLTVTGTDFVGQPTVYWNGNALPTTQVSGAELSAQIPASDLASVGQAAITVSNTGTTSPASNSMPFSVNAAPPSGNQISVYSTGGNDLVWDANAAKIYVSMPGSQVISGDTIAIVDPVAGTVTNTAFPGSDPANLSISSDGQSLYMALYGQNAIQQLALPNFTVNTAWNLGGVGSFSGPYYALDLQSAPGAPQTTAVVLSNFDVSPSPAAVVIYDMSTPRTNPLPVTRFPYSSLQWASSSSTLYAVDQEEPQDFLVLGVGPSGAVLDQPYNGVVNPYSPTIHYDAGTGLVYTDGGQAIQPSNGNVAGSYGASGIAIPDSMLGTVFILGQTAAQADTSNYTIESFDQTQFTAIGSIMIENVVGTPTALIRWGNNGLAFTTLVGMPADFTGTGPGQLYVISGDFVQSASAARKSSGTKPLLPVRRTWGLKRSLRPQSPSMVVNPFRH